jgi:hypothetical protein
MMEQSLFSRELHRLRLPFKFSIPCRLEILFQFLELLRFMWANIMARRLILFEVGGRDGWIGLLCVD